MTGMGGNKGNPNTLRSDVGRNMEEGVFRPEQGI